MAVEMKQVPARIKMARQLAGKTQEQAADDLGVSTRTYIRWEQGKSDGYLGRLDEIASVLGVDPAEFMVPGMARTSGESEMTIALTDAISRDAEVLGDILREVRGIRMDMRRLSHHDT